MRKCVFCGREGASREHVWKRSWFGEVLPTADEGEWVHSYEEGDDARIWHNRELDVVVKGPCESCNNGWMNELDDAARPLVDPMILAQHVQLSPANQALLATWTAKIAMMLDLARAEPAVLPEQRHWLYEKREPPPNALIWLAAVADDDVRINYPRYTIGQRNEGSVGVNDVKHYLVAFRVRHFAAKVVIPRLPLDFSFVGNQARFVVSIWPTNPSSVSWPPERWLRTTPSSSRFPEHSSTLPSGDCSPTSGVSR